MFSPSRRTYAPPPETSGSLSSLIWAAGLGAAIMYLLDPDNGRRRRALVKDKAAHYAHLALEKQDALARQTLNHVQGALANIRGHLKPAEPVDDVVLIERVRAALGHVLRDANAIDVKVREGTVILKGPVTTAEMSEIVACAERVRGVLQVENRLSPNSMGTNP